MGQSEHVEPKDTPSVTSNKHHPNPSAGAVKTDGGRKKAGKEEKTEQLLEVARSSLFFQQSWDIWSGQSWGEIWDRGGNTL